MMMRQVFLRHRSSVNRRQPLLATTNSSSSLSTLSLSSRAGGGGGGGNASIGEVAGGTAAECAAVCCCCPCALVNFLYLTVYKLPAGICRKALQQKRRRRLLKNGLLPQRSCRCRCGCDDTELQIHPISVDVAPAADMIVESIQADNDVIQLEKEMWDRFYGTGFWRSPSQRSNV
ncbi:hypothetical protein U1Q18_013906 [Sarracenia purpurea var. burkii]